jgi:hypothetical protein
MLLGCAALITLALLAAAVPLRALMKQGPRELLATVRG